MVKIFNIILIFAITCFTLPLGNIAVSAEKLDPAHLTKGVYTIDYTFFKVGEDAVSTMDNFTDGPAYLTIDKEGKQTITITFTNASMIEWFEVNGQKATTLKEDQATDTKEVEFAVDQVTKKQDGTVFVNVPGMYSTAHDIDLIFDANSLVMIESENEEEPEQPTGAQEERIVRTLMTENEADTVYELTYGTDSNSTKGQLLNPVTLLEKDDKQFIQISINESGAQYFKSLQINGEQVAWNSITEGPYTIQFELLGKLEDHLTLDMVIQAGTRVMQHNDIKIWFNLETMKEKVEPEQPDEETEAENDKEPAVPVEIPENSRKINYKVKHDKEDKESAADGFFTKPATLFEKNGNQYIQFTIKSWDMIEWLRTDQGNAVIVKDNGDSAIIQIQINGKLSDAIHLTMKVNVPGMYSVEHGARLFLDVETDKENDNGDAVQIPTPKPVPAPTPNQPMNQSKNTPEKVYTIDYVVKHETEDKVSASDTFFQKPATILYLNGQKYIQLTINNWDMINWLHTAEGNDVTVVKENADGSALIQFKANGDLGEEIFLSMSVTVPGVYENMIHTARLVLDVDSKSIVEVADHQVIFESGPEKPAFGDNENNDKKITHAQQTKNPKTGDSTNILLLSLLLIGSFIPLAMKYRKHLIK